MFFIHDIQKKSEGIAFEQTLELSEELKNRDPGILDLSPVTVVGKVRFEGGLFFLSYQMTYDLTLASSRSMQPVLLSESYPVQEIFVANEHELKEQDRIEADLVLIAEDGLIDLSESVADNILLRIPLKVLTPEEALTEEMPSGEHWSVMSEEEYAEAAQKKKEENSPFAQLQGLFDDE